MLACTPSYSARSSTVEVRAAARPGSVATRLAKMSAPSATRAINAIGTVGSGTASRLRANWVHSTRPTTTPSPAMPERPAIAGA